MLYEPGMSCRQYVCFNLVHCVMFCWQINDDDDENECHKSYQIICNININDHIKIISDFSPS